MNKKQIKLLALKSFIKNNLDYKKVKTFTGKMTRADLRKYINYLKIIEARNSVTITVPDLDKVKKIDLDKVKKLYPNKKIKYLEDESLILGIKIIDNDLIHDYNLKNTFDSIKAQV